LKYLLDDKSIVTKVELANIINYLKVNNLTFRDLNTAKKENNRVKLRKSNRIFESLVEKNKIIRRNPISKNKTQQFKRQNKDQQTVLKK
jgi:hypothetical protein